MIKFFKRNKKSYSGTILGPFFPNLGKNKYSWIKRTPPVFKYSKYLPSFKKFKKSNDPFLRKIPSWHTDGQADRQTDRKRWFHKTHRRTEVQLNSLVGMMFNQSLKPKISFALIWSLNIFSLILFRLVFLASVLPFLMLFLISEFFFGWVFVLCFSW